MERIQVMKKELDVEDEECLLHECEEHMGLATYQPAHVERYGRTGVNRCVYNNKHGVTKAAAVGHLICGGQGLRGGDPRLDSDATRQTCCVHCLKSGTRIAETLKPVSFECAEYEDIRAPIQHLLAEEGEKVFNLQRDAWGWSQLREIMRFFTEMLQQRAHEWGRPGPRAEQRMQQEADILWDLEG